MYNYPIKPVIKRMLSITEEKYNEMLFNTAMEYLERYLKHDTPIINDFATHPGFWSWWKIQYYYIDRVFEDKYFSSNLNREQLLSIYSDMHSKMDKHIDNVLWEMISDKQEEMIHKMIKEKVKR